MLFACGFCGVGPGVTVLPLLHVWAGVFAVWWLFLGKYDPQSVPERVWWLIGTAGVLVLGAVVSVDLWVGWLLAWSLIVVRRTLVHRADARRASQDRISSAAGMMKVARFHAQTLILLGAALGLKAGLHWLGLGIRL